MRTAATKKSVTPSLFGEVRNLILHARQQVAQAIDAALTMTYWQASDRIQREILNEKHAGYGEEIAVSLARQLEAEFGRGFSVRSLRHTIGFAEVFQDEPIVSALRRQLGWIPFSYSMVDLETARAEFGRLLLELGTGFAFVKRQQRLTLDSG